MNLSSAFSIQPNEVVSFVGGGGKTTAMFRLAAELVQDGMRVVTTTTTRIFAAQIQLAPQHIFATNTEQTLRGVRDALDAYPHVLVIGATSQEGKAFGIEPALVDALIAQNQVDVVLIEADGSRMRPFKAPGEHEPVVPRSTTLLVPVVGIDALGQPLNDVHVHRAELVAQRLGIPLGNILNTHHIAQLVAHPQGGLKNKPDFARAIPLINKVHSEHQRESAREIAHQLLQYKAIDGVAIGAVKNEAQPAMELIQRVAAIILAAGGSTRMQGAVKQLLPWGDSTLVRNAVNLAQQAHVSEIIVVTGNHASEVEQQVTGTKARVVQNPDWASGRASSIRVGIRTLQPKTAAAIFINADQPFLSSQVIDSIIHHYNTLLAPIIAPTYNGVIGSPVLFARAMFDKLNSLEGDQGGRELLRIHNALVEKIAIPDTRAATDIDTLDEYQAALKESQSDESAV